MRVSDGFILRPFGDKYIVVAVDDAADDFHGLITLNEPGVELWKQLEKGTTYDALLKSITDTYDVDEQTARTDLDAFLKTADDAGLIYE